MIAIGIGANNRAVVREFAEAIAGIRDLANGGDLVATLEDATFATLVEKAAALVDLDCQSFPLDRLKARSRDCQTHSQKSFDLFGVASIAEAAALVAAGPGSLLVVSRRTFGNVTAACARSAIGRCLG